MRIERDRVGQRQRPEVGRSLRQRRRGRAVGAVNVKPEPLLGADVGERLQRVDDARADAAGRADDEERQAAIVAVRGQLPPQRIETHSPVRVRLDPADALRAETADVGRLLDPGMRFP